MVHPKVYPIIVGPFTYGIVYDPQVDDFRTCLHIPMRRDDIGPSAYEDIARDSSENIRDMLWAEYKHPSHWNGHPILDPSIWYLQAQLTHYGLEQYETKKECRERMRGALREGKLKVPNVIRELEIMLKDEHGESKRHQEDMVKRKLNLKDEEVLKTLEQKGLVGLKLEHFRMWETSEGIDAFAKKTARGRYLLGIVREKILNEDYEEDIRQQWQDSLPRMLNRVEQMEAMLEKLVDGSFFETSEEYSEYCAVHGRIDEESFEEHLESIRYRDRLYGEANDEERSRMRNPHCTPTLLDDLVNALKDSWDSSVYAFTSHRQKNGKHEWGGNLSGFSDGFYSKNIHNDMDELDRRYREWDAFGSSEAWDNSHQGYSPDPGESARSRRAGTSDWREWYKDPTPDEEEKARARRAGPQQGWVHDSSSKPDGETSRPMRKEQGDSSANIKASGTRPHKTTTSPLHFESPTHVRPTPSLFSTTTGSLRSPKPDLKYLAIQRVLKCRPEDHHQILGVDRGADEREIRTSFLNLSMLLHPDKNAYEGAGEAFKIMEVAYRVLQPK